MSTIRRVGRQHTSYRAHDLLTSTYSSYFLSQLLPVTASQLLPVTAWPELRWDAQASHVLEGPHPLCSRTSRHLLQRAAHSEGTSSFRLFQCFLFYPVHTLLNIFSSGYFIPLCLCDFSLHCICIQSLSVFAMYVYIHHVYTHVIPSI
jgi:hypothetical protein